MTTTKEKVRDYIISNPTESISPTKMGKKVGVSKQRISQILQQIGYKIPKTSIHTCRVCTTKIQKTSNYCMAHKNIKTRRFPGLMYPCRLCKEFKKLEEFAKSNGSKYEHRCLVCRAKVQRDFYREYYKTEKGKELRRKLQENQANKYPERYRAYNVHYRNLKKGKIIQQKCEICSSENSRAVFLDYVENSIRWLCVKCHKNTYVPKPIPRPITVVEKAFSGFANKHGYSKATIARWLYKIKEYNANSIDYGIIRSSLDTNSIYGIGKEYKQVAKKFLHHSGMNSYKPNNQD